MADIKNNIKDFLINERWPANNPDVIQLYSFPTPNGVKISIMLEETGLAYETHKVTLSDEDVRSSEFLSLNPNNKIPAIIDPSGPDGSPIALFESGAILVYLAEKSEGFIGANATERYHVLQWLMFQMGGLGPMFGQLGFFHMFAGKEIDDPRPKERYVGEAKRLLNVLNGALDGKHWLVGDYSIADIAIAPWLNTLQNFYKAGDLVGFESFSNVKNYLERFLERPAVQRGLNIPSLD